MPGSFPQYSNIYPELASLLAKRGGNNNPLSMGGVSGLSTWIRLISSVSPNGLVLESIHDSANKGNGFGVNYGGNNPSYKGSGIIGHNLNGDQVWVKGGLDRTLRPSPIITGISIDENVERGSRIATIKITAFTLKQAELISEYFLEPAFHCVCEWGWNTQKSVAQKCSGGSKINVCDMVEYDNWKTITEKRLKSEFTYDAFLGIVTGGGISFGDNETFEVELKLVSTGSVASYLQIHKDANPTDTPKKDSSDTFTSQQIDAAVGADNVGRALFMQMYNELPGQKRTPYVKKLIDNVYWANEGNFVNMDKVIRELLAEAASEGAEMSSENSSADVKIPKDIPLISEDRYIRFELAAAIVNSYPIILEPQKSECKNVETKDQRINIYNTICAGFPHMFSTDKSKLYIPNTTAPNFNLTKALSSSEPITDFIVFDKLNLEENLANIHPLTGTTKFKANQNEDKKDFALGQNRPAPYAFPATYGLLKTFKIDGTFEDVVEEPYFWGYLRNLYINFDFFVECISKPNFVIKDVFYEMLNGMSSACNSLWNFQIIDNPNKETGAYELQVVDLNFSGIVDIKKPITTFQARGIESPFVSCDFGVEIPGAMMSSVVMKKLSDNIDHSPELNPRPMRGTIFSKREDKVGTILQGLKQIKKEEELNKDSNTAPEKSSDELEQEARALNYEYYTKTAAVLPKSQNRNSNADLQEEWYDFYSANDATLEKTFMVGAWNDTAALRQVYLVDKGIAKGGNVERKNSENNTQNPPLGMATFDFRVHGVSGFKVGDKFRIDGVPSQFGKPNFFQIVKVDHVLEGMNWWTDVKGKLRIIGDEK